MQLNAKGFIIVRKALKKATYFLFANELSSRLKRVFHHLIKQKQNRVQINQFLNFCEFLLPTFPSHRRKLLTEEYLPNHTTIVFLSVVIFSNTIYIKQFRKNPRTTKFTTATKVSWSLWKSCIRERGH